MPLIDYKTVFAVLKEDIEHNAYYMLADLSEQLAEEIKFYRLQKGMSQEELAKKLDTRQSLVSRLENPAYARYTLLTLAKVAVALDVQLNIAFSTETQQRQPDFNSYMTGGTESFVYATQAISEVEAITFLSPRPLVAA